MFFSRKNDKKHRFNGGFMGAHMSPAYVNALQAVLDKFEQTFFDIEMMICIMKVRITGKILNPQIGKMPSNPGFVIALTAYVKSVYDVLKKFEKTFYEEDMVSRVKKADDAGKAVLAVAAPITIYEVEQADMEHMFPWFWTVPYNIYCPVDKAYKIAVKYVFQKFMEVFKDGPMLSLISTYLSSE
jgi:hypothetical protein